MKNNGSKKTFRRFVIKTAITLFILASVFALFNYLNSGSLDEQIQKAEEINGKLKSRSIAARTRKLFEQLRREEEKIKSLPVQLIIQDNLKTELEKLIEEKNLDYETTEQYFEENKDKIFSDKKGHLMSKPLREEPEKSSDQIHLEKVERLNKLKEENRQLTAEILTETLRPDIKKKRLQELDAVQKDIDDFRSVLRNPKRFDESIASLKMQIEVVKKIPPGWKPKGRNRDVEKKEEVR